MTVQFSPPDISELEIERVAEVLRSGWYVLGNEVKSFEEEYAAYTGGNYWTNPVNYDLTFNNARLGDERCVKLTLDCMKLKFEDDFVEYMKSIGKDI